MQTFFDYLNKMGGLHDATVEHMHLDLASETVALRFDNLYSNFEGLPEYPGAESGTIVLTGVSVFEMNVDSMRSLKVYEFLQYENRPDEVLVTFSPGGRLRIRFKGADYPACRV